MKHLFLFLSFAITIATKAQNVGIGTNIPGYPLTVKATNATTVISATNNDPGNSAAVYGSTSSSSNGTNTAGATGVIGEAAATSGGAYSAGVRGINRSTFQGMGVLGYHAGNGYGVYGNAPSGTGVAGYSDEGTGGYFFSNSSNAIFTVGEGLTATLYAINGNSSNLSGTIYGENYSTAAGTVNFGASAICGVSPPTSGGTFSAGVRGMNYSTTGSGVGVVGYQAGSGYGVWGETASGSGVYGYSAASGIGVTGVSVSYEGGSFISNSGTAIAAYSPNGTALSALTDGTNHVIIASNTNTGNSAGTIYGISGSTVVSGAAASGGSGVVGEMTATLGGYFSAGLRGINRSTNGSGMGVVGYQAGTGIGVYGETAAAGMGVSGYSPSGQGGNFGANSGTALVASSVGGIAGNFSSTSGTTVLLANSVSSGNIAVFQAAGGNVARIDRTGKGFFNNGTQTGGADLAEAFAVEGNRSDYEPGDVLVISTTTDRTVTKSNTSYSTSVAGVYATKPGVLLTERMESETQSDLVPMGVVGVIPTKVCIENGPIHRGDLLVTSSIPGRAMKATQSQIQYGSVIGKALEDFTAAGNGLIKVLVNVR